MKPMLERLVPKFKMGTRWFGVGYLALLLIFSACGGGGGGGTVGGGTNAERVAVSGRAMLLDDDVEVMGIGVAPQPESGISVTVSADIDGNGSIDSTEQVSTTTDDDGNFSVNAPVAVGTRIVVRFEETGYATQLKTVDINSINPVSGVDATLSRMRTLTQTSDRWRDSGNSVSVSNIEIESGSARAFNPATESDRFPGAFTDSQGNMLISGVFAAFDLRDSSGRSIRAVSSANPATVRMKIPRDTWGVLKDLDPATELIDVPMYYFDEETGEWVREGTGHLEDADGNPITASQLATITATPPTYTGQVYAVSEATHFSYWNVDYPVDTHACVSGTITDELGAPVAGASVSLAGLSYNGTSETAITDANGHFCADVMRNEESGEDLDGDGMTGETQEFSLTVRSGASLYRLDQFALTSGQGSCPTGCMTQDFQLSAATQIQVACCTVSGIVYDPNGAPMEGAMVFAFDESIETDLMNNVCADATGFYDMSLADGSYEVSAELGTGLKLHAFKLETVGDVNYYYWGQMQVTTCPTSALSFTTDLVYCTAQLQVTISGQQISWSPNVTVNTLFVTDSTSGSIKWSISSDSGFTSPVTFGSLPAGATALVAASGTLTATDLVMVSGRFTDSGTGTECYNSGWGGNPGTLSD